MPDASPEYIRELLLRFSLEAVFVSTALLLAWRRLGWSRVFAGLGRRAGRAAVVFVAALTVVQLVDRWQYEFPPRASWYPLARFAMYQTGTIDTEGILTYRFLLERGGEEVQFDPTERFGAVGLPSLNTRFRVVSERLLTGDVGEVAWAEEQLRLYAESFLRGIEARGEPEVEAVHFEVWRYPVGTVRPEGGALLRRVTHPGGGGGR